MGDRGRIFFREHLPAVIAMTGKRLVECHIVTLGFW
jgi:hypothetical protein